MKYSSVARFILVLVTAALAGTAQRPSVGKKAPDFALSTPQGKTMRLSDMVSAKPVVLVVLRGYPGYQCPMCNRQVQDFVQNASKLAAVSSRVIMVYPGAGETLKEKAEEFMAGKQFPQNFELLLDPEYEFTELYGLRWDAPQETAHPSTFLIDETGNIFFSKISDSHGDRTKAAEIIEILEKRKQP